MGAAESLDFFPLNTLSRLLSELRLSFFFLTAVTAVEAVVVVIVGVVVSVVVVGASCP